MTACNKQRAPAGSATGGARSAVGATHARHRALVAEQLDAELQFSPTLASWLGDHTSDDRLDDVRLETVLREVARLENLLERVRHENDSASALAAEASRAGSAPGDGGEAHVPGPGRAPEAGLPHDAVAGLLGGAPDAQRLDLILLQARIESRRFELLEWRPHERNPIFYANIIAFGLDSLLGPSLATPSGLRALRGRLLAIPTVCREAQRNLKNPPELWVRRAIELTQMTRDFVAGLLPRMLANLNLTLDPKLQEEVGHLREDAQRALEEFGVWLSHELLPRSKGEWALPAGRLQAWLRASELLDVPVETLQERAEFEHREARHRLEELAKRLTGLTSPSRAVAEAQHLIDEDHPRPEELTHTVEAALDRAYEQASAQGLLTVPPLRPQLVEMPAYRFGYLQLSLPAPLEAERTAQLFLDPVDPSWKDKKRVSDHLRMLNRAQILLTVAREVMPGSFARQQAQGAAAATLSPLRQRTRSLALLEGWAGYAEELVALEPAAAVAPGPAGGGAAAVNERLQILVLRQQLLRLGRLIVALRLHAAPSGIPPVSARLEQAADFFTEQCFLEEYAARREAERATYDPLSGAAALGRLQLLQLRADYQAEHREDFSLKSFHDALLAQGSLPVVALRQLLLRRPGPSIRPAPEPEPSAATGDDN